MNIVLLNNNAQILGSTSNSLSLNTSVQSSASSSKDIASISQIPSVNVILSSQANASAVINASIPPIYSRVSVGASTSTQLSPSRNASSPTSEQTIKTVADDSTQTKAQQPVSNNTNNQAQQAKSVTNALSDQEQNQIAALKIRDQEVKSHELAHKSVGGRYAGAISLSYQTGPNGKRYAVGGEVPIDVSPVSGDPQATITKMNTVRAAATAPANPSSQDQRIAAVAASILSQARFELVQKNRAEAGAKNSKEHVSNDTQKISALVSDKGVIPLENSKKITIDTIV